jgi:PKD domain
VRILLSTCAVLLLSTAAAAAKPKPDFTFSPSVPTVGESVTFTPSPTRALRRATVDWDFQNDGVPDVRNAPAWEAVTYSYPQAGTFNVRMLVRRHNEDEEDEDEDDEGDDEDVLSVVKPITVNAPPIVGPTAPAIGEDVLLRSFSTPAGLSLMNPFPVVRLAGSLYPRGVKVRALEAKKTPPDSSVTVLCAGKSCPSKKIVKTAEKKRVRFDAMTRFLWAGTVISVSVRKTDLIGKYTRWRIRGGKLPTRTDRCVYPNRRKPVRCPA